jgi:Recombination endonuclease VII
VSKETKRARERERVRRWREANPDRDRQYRAANRDRELERVWRSRGIRPKDWAAMWDAQDGKCYLCREDLIPGKTHVDHDHSCCPKNQSCAACRRGLAHGNCNAAIGLAGDDPDRLRRMADNLEHARNLATERIAAKPQQLPLL